MAVCGRLRIVCVRLLEVCVSLPAVCGHFWSFTGSLWLLFHGCSNHSNLEMEVKCLTKTLSYWNLISPEQKMLETSCKKCENKEEL